MSASTATSQAHEVWTIERLLRWMQGYFKERGLDAPRLDAELLVAHALHVNRTYLYTHNDQPLTQAERDVLRALVKRRASFEPMAYILGVREFYGRDFKVCSDVLVPRPETEHVVEAVLSYAKLPGMRANLRILDIGTGSGALALTLAAELQAAEVVALDISSAALAVARANAQALGLSERVQFFESDLFAGLPKDAAPFDVIVSNPPYIATPEKSKLAPDVRDYEPGQALFAGLEGLDVLGPLCAQVAKQLRPGGLFATEIGCTQSAAVTQLLRAAHAWERCEVVADLQGLPRVVVAQRAECE